MQKTLLFSLISVLLLSACAQQAVQQPSQPTTSASGNVQVSIKNFAFSPADITIHVGDTVVWTNEDAVSHIIQSNDGTFKSQELRKGDTFQFTFNTKGTYNYICSIHPSMHGSVKVE